MPVASQSWFERNRAARFTLLGNSERGILFVTLRAMVCAIEIYLLFGKFAVRRNKNARSGAFLFRKIFQCNKAPADTAFEIIRVCHAAAIHALYSSSSILNFAEATSLPSISERL